MSTDNETVTIYPQFQKEVFIASIGWALRQGKCVNCQCPLMFCSCLMYDDGAGGMKWGDS